MLQSPKQHVTKRRKIQNSPKSESNEKDKKENNSPNPKVGLKKSDHDRFLIFETSKGVGASVFRSRHRGIFTE